MEGFSFSKLYFTDHFTYVHVRGEAINQSGKNYTDVYFTIKLYDDKNDLLGISLIMLSHFANNKKKAFDSTTTDYLDIKMIKRYEIVFESGE